MIIYSKKFIFPQFFFFLHYPTFRKGFYFRTKFNLSLSYCNTQKFQSINTTRAYKYQIFGSIPGESLRTADPYSLEFCIMFGYFQYSDVSILFHVYAYVFHVCVYHFFIFCMIFLLFLGFPCHLFKNYNFVSVWYSIFRGFLIFFHCCVTKNTQNIEMGRRGVDRRY